jgi:hypothetical protein
MYAHLRRHAGGFFGGSFRPRVESLEGRLCLSVTVSTVNVHGESVLKIVGDSGANEVSIVDNGSGHVDVSQGGAIVGSGDDISAIKFYGKDGTDTVH